MLRAVSAIYAESQAHEVFALARKDVYKLFRTQPYSTSAPGVANQVRTVVTGNGGKKTTEHVAGDGAACPPPGPPPPPPPRPAPPLRRAWTAAAAAIAAAASLGGVYFYRKLSDEEAPAPAPAPKPSRSLSEWEEEPVEPEPAEGAALPAHAHFLLVGGGTASFAAMRALRAARPDALVLIVGAEPHPPYMRPPLSKELWREPALGATPPAALDALSFRQWNGKRRPLAYEPLEFYTPLPRAEAEGGAGAGGAAAVARGWRVTALDVERREAVLAAPGRAPVSLTYDACLLATGSRARRVPALSGARAAHRCHALRSARDAVRLARALDAVQGAGRVVLVGGGFLATELAAALAERLRGGGGEGGGRGARVTLVFREEAPLARVLPPYLAQEAARRLRDAGVELVPRVEVVDSAGTPAGDGVTLTLRAADDGGEGGEGGEGGTRALEAALCVECCGAEPDTELARAAGLEEHPALGGVLVTAELQARSGVWAAGDVACFYDVALGRRRVEHHDHAVVSGRLAGENMAGVKPPRPFTHQSMFWSDLGPDLGYEAIGIIDSRLPTVGVFASTAVEAESRSAAAGAGDEEGEGETRPGQGEEEGTRYERGVVFYTREKRVVGVLLWNLFNRMHVARQVLAQGEFEDLFEVGKLFSLHEDE